MGKKRLNIGLLVDDVDAVFTAPAVQGAELGARAIDANLFIVPGRYLDNADEFQPDRKYGYQYNTLFEYVRNSHMDVLYIMMGMIGSRVDEAARLEFLKKYAGIPVVTLYTRTKGYPSIIFDNKIAFNEGIVHIIRDHHARKLGYVSGPATNVDAVERLEAYRDALRMTGLPYNEDYVIYGNFEESSEGMIGEFVDRHPELDAVIFANDRMAYGGYRAFEKRGIVPGRDVCVLSFDNSEFAPGLNPPLSTVEANAAELSYKAILRAEKIVREGQVDDLYTDTRLILRSSCGCDGLNAGSVIKQTGMDNIMDDELRSDTYYKVCDYLFNDYIKSEEADCVRENVTAFLDAAVACRRSSDIQAAGREMKRRFEDVLRMETFRYTTLEYVANMLSALQIIMCRDADLQQQTDIMHIFIDLLREMALDNWQMIYGNNAGMGRMTKFINTMTADMFRMDSGEHVPYERVLDNLSYVNMQSAYLFMYKEPVHHKRFTEFDMPDKIMFKAYYSDNKAHSIPEDEQEINSCDIFANSMMPEGRRVTMVLSPIFSGEDIFGVLLSETDFEHFKNIDPVSVHVSTAIKSMVLLEQQDKVQSGLEETMAKLVENNDVLRTISKTDQLTGLLNRWGFLDAVKKVCESAPLGAKGMFMYADMDGLKGINDNYGHDDGDFALRTISQILRHACDGDAIISRFGGDEFVVYSAWDGEGCDKRLTAAIECETDALNANVGKPYRIEMSTGFCIVECTPDLDVYRALAHADQILYQHKRAKKLKKGKTSKNTR